MENLQFPGSLGPYCGSIPRRPQPDKAVEGRSMWWFRTQTEEADSWVLSASAALSSCRIVTKSFQVTDSSYVEWG